MHLRDAVVAVLLAAAFALMAVRYAVGVERLSRRAQTLSIYVLFALAAVAAFLPPGTLGSVAGGALDFVAVTLGAAFVVYFRIMTWEDPTRPAAFARELAFLAVVLNVILALKSITSTTGPADSVWVVVVVRLLVAAASYGVWLYCTESDARTRPRLKIFLGTASLTLGAYAILSETR